MATFDPELRRQLIPFAPLVLLKHSALEEFGDENQRLVVKAIIEPHRSQPNIPIDVWGKQLRHLHSAALVDYLVSAWNSRPSSAHARSFILELARARSMPKFVPIFNQVLGSATATYWEKLTAIHGLGAIQDFEALRLELVVQLDQESAELDDESTEHANIVDAILLHLINGALPLDLLTRAMALLYRSAKPSWLGSKLAESTDHQLVNNLIVWVANEAWRTRKPWEEFGEFICESPHYCELVLEAASRHLSSFSSRSKELIHACVIILLFCNRYSKVEFADTLVQRLQQSQTDVLAIVATLATEHVGPHAVLEFLEVLELFRIRDRWTREFAKSAMTSVALQHIIRRTAVLTLTSSVQDPTALREPLLAKCGQDSELRAFVILRTEPAKLDRSDEAVALEVKANQRRAKNELARANENEK